MAILGSEGVSPASVVMGRQGVSDLVARQQNGATGSRCDPSEERDSNLELTNKMRVALIGSIAFLIFLALGATLAQLSKDGVIHSPLDVSDRLISISSQLFITFAIYYVMHKSFASYKAKKLKTAREKTDSKEMIKKQVLTDKTMEYKLKVRATAIGAIVSLMILAIGLTLSQLDAQKVLKIPEEATSRISGVSTQLFITFVVYYLFHTSLAAQRERMEKQGEVIRPSESEQREVQWTEAQMATIEALVEKRIQETLKQASILSVSATASA